MIFDSHAHYDDEAFDPDRDSVLSGMAEKQVTGILNCGSDISSSTVSLQLTKQYSFLYAAVGIHPHAAAETPLSHIKQLKQMANEHQKVVAIGEIGLDYHYDFSPKEIQLQWFEQQILLAKELDLPVVIHDREAHGDTLSLLEQHRPRGVVHCFSGSVEMAEQILRLGMYVGLGGAVTFKNAKKPLAVATAVPLDRLLLETDCPYMAPVPFRGKRCDSSMIAHTADAIAAARQISAEEVINTARQNTLKLFQIGR